MKKFAAMLTLVCMCLYFFNLNNASASTDFLRVTMPFSYDDFNDNVIDNSLWINTGVAGGGGPVATEIDQRLLIRLPAESSGNAFSVGYRSTCKLRGDYDIQADYLLLEFPPQNGVRVGLVAGSAAVERPSGSNHDSWPTGEHYTTDFYGTANILPTSDRMGKLRLVRTGNALIGYFFESSTNTWQVIGSGTGNTDDVSFSLGAWSHDFAFDNQNVSIGFDNMIINNGELVCETSPPTAPFLSFPLAGYTPYTAPVSSVFDHSGIAFSGIGKYNEDKIVETFEGEIGNQGPANKSTCYGKDDVVFGLGFNYVGTSSTGGKKFLCYDGHPGTDYSTRNIVADGHVPVLAAANGTHKRGSDKYGELIIDHGNGYRSIYLHLQNDSRIVDNAPPVVSGQQIGIAGGTGPNEQGIIDPDAFPVHLHFEVQKYVEDGKWIPVDPYGWKGTTDPKDDPYFKTNNIENTKLWTDNPPVLVNLNVAKGGTGAGTVSCGDTCLDQYVKGTVVTLTASPSSTSSLFNGWSVTGGTIVSGCASSGSGPCEVKLDADTTTVTGTFSPAVVNPPKLSGSIGLKGWQSANVMFVNLKITNTGSGNAQNIIASDFAFKTLAGSGAVTYNTSLSPAKPVTIGNLNVGESKVITLYLNVPPTVTRFSISEGGTVQDVLCQGSTYLISQTIFKSLF